MLFRVERVRAIRSSLLGGVCLCLTAPLVAQTRPDAGSLRQEIEQSRPVSPLPLISPPIRPSPPKAASAELTITLKGFVFSGNTLIASSVLEKRLADFLGKPLTFAQLQEITDRVASDYRDAGWLARAILLPQDFAEGVLKVHIIEARFGLLRQKVPNLENKPRIDTEIVSRMVDRHLPAGEPISAARLDRVLMLLEELPGLSAQGSLTAGAREGETDLLLLTQGDPLLSGEARLDNNGSRSTGPERLTGRLNVASLLGWGDTLSAQWLKTEGSDYGRLAYSKVLNADGWVGGLNLSDMRYRLVGSDFSSLRANGVSTSTGAELSIPLHRSRQLSSNYLFNLDEKHFSNYSQGAVTTQYVIRTASAGISGQRQDAWFGGGVTQGSFVWLAGMLDLDGSPNQANDSTTTQTDGGFQKVRYQFSRQQTLLSDLSLSMSWSGQRANKNLDSAEKFYLGGASGVRAYPSSEAGGADGDLIFVELSKKLADGVNMTAFYDWGRVRVNVNNNYSGAPSRNELDLKGGGLSLNWISPVGFQARLTWSRRLGDNPNPTAAGMDQDGTLIRDRLWLSAAWNF